MEVVQLDFQVTPLRVERFVDSTAPRCRSRSTYGAKGYSFYRNEEDAGHFVHVSYWDDREEFDRYWMSREMRDIRTRINGMHDHLLLPHYGDGARARVAQDPVRRLGEAPADDLGTGRDPAAWAGLGRQLLEAQRLAAAGARERRIGALPQPSWTSSTGGPLPPSAHRSPHAINASSAVASSRPFCVRT